MNAFLHQPESSAFIRAIRMSVFAMRLCSRAARVPVTENEAAGRLNFHGEGEPAQPVRRSPYEFISVCLSKTSKVPGHVH
jgi:hypothetical protein